MIDKIADMLNYREYLDEVTPEIRKMAKENNIVIVYGRSDDLMIFDGAIEDEAGCFQGGTVYVNKNGVISVADNCDCPYLCKNCEYIKAEYYKCKIIRARRYMSNDVGWTYETDDIYHKTFNIMEDGEIYCKGIVFMLNELEVKE